MMMMFITHSYISVINVNALPQSMIPVCFDNYRLISSIMPSQPANLNIQYLPFIML